MSNDATKNNPSKDTAPGFPFDSQDLQRPMPREYEELAEEKGYKPGLFTRVAEFLANDIVAGMILMIAAVLALIFANSPIRDIYANISSTHIAIPQLLLDLSVQHWAQDGILVIFFFAVGLELKQEFSVGSLHDPRTALLPILAALFGMIGPAVVYTTVTAISGSGAWHGWAIPTATDIAFAVAILQIFGRALPSAARIFLLTLAVADDLGGILVIAIFYAQGLNFAFLAGAIATAAVFGLLCYKRWGRWWILIPLGVVCWWMMLQSGVHATISGVLLGMMVPARPNATEEEAMTERFNTYINPISAGIAVPIFAFFAAGVNVVDTPGGALAMLSHPVTIAVTLALPLGKFLGIFGSVFVLTKLTSLHLGKGIGYADIFPISFVAGIGFTVALLISHLSFVGDEVLTQAGSLGVLLGTLTSIIIGSILVSVRCRAIRKAKVTP